MTKLDPHDPRPLLALLLALVVLWFSRHLSGLSPTSLLSSTGGSLAPIAVGALVLASALAIQRLVLTDRTLRSRRELAVIPADDFDPKPDAVLRFAAELVSTRRSTLGWLDRRASAVRVRLTRDPDGRVVYLLGVPERSVRLLRAALETYDGIEVRDAGDVLTGGDPGERLASVRTELVLGRSSLKPLARLALDPDPLQPFATALASGRSHAGVEVSVCLDLLTASGHRREHLRRSLRRRASRQFGSRPGLLERLEGGGQGRSRPGPDELLGRRLVNESLDAKLRDSGTLFEAQILIRCRAHERSDAKAAMQHVLAAFEPYHPARPERGHLPDPRGDGPGPDRPRPPRCRTDPGAPRRQPDGLRPAALGPPPGGDRGLGPETLLGLPRRGPELRRGRLGEPRRAARAERQVRPAGDAPEQNPERLSPQTLNAVTTNRSHLISTALNSHAAALLTREWGGRPSPEVLVGLPRYRFVAQGPTKGS